MSFRYELQKRLPALLDDVDTKVVLDLVARNWQAAQLPPPIASQQNELERGAGAGNW